MAIAPSGFGTSAATSWSAASATRRPPRATGRSAAISLDARRRARCRGTLTGPQRDDQPTPVCGASPRQRRLGRHLGHALLHRRDRRPDQGLLGAIAFTPGGPAVVAATRRPPPPSRRSRRPKAWSSPVRRLVHRHQPSFTVSEYNYVRSIGATARPTRPGSSRSRADRAPRSSSAGRTRTPTRESTAASAISPSLSMSRSRTD